MSNRALWILVSLLMGTTGVLAGSATSSSKVAGDLRVPQTMHAPTGIESVSRDAVTYSRAVRRGESLHLSTTEIVSRSREYFLEVSGEELSRGVAIHSHGPGALIRINPAGAAKGAILGLEELQIQAPDGRSFRSADAASLLVSAEELREAAPFPEGTVAFRLADELGPGQFVLSRKASAATERWVIHVLDAGSPVEMTLRTAKADHFVGESLRVEAGLLGEQFDRVNTTGFITSPSGEVFDLRFDPNAQGGLAATLEIPRVEEWAPGLWEVHAFTEASLEDRLVLRNLRTAFNVVWPTARLDGVVRNYSNLESSGDRVYSLGVEVASDGRYEIRGVLYTRLGGDWEPVAIAHGADWMNAGNGQLELRFERRAIGDATGPFQLRAVELRDQSRLSVLERRERVPLNRRAP